MSPHARVERGEQRCRRSRWRRRRGSRPTITIAISTGKLRVVDRARDQPVDARDAEHGLDEDHVGDQHRDVGADERDRRRQRDRQRVPERDPPRRQPLRGRRARRSPRSSTSGSVARTIRRHIAASGSPATSHGTSSACSHATGSSVRPAVGVRR